MKELVKDVLGSEKKHKKISTISVKRCIHF